MKKNILITLALLILANGVAQAEEKLQQLVDSANKYTPQKNTNCETTILNILYDNFIDKKIACEGARRALNFFKKAGINFQETITINMVPEVRMPYGKDENGTEWEGGGMKVVGMWTPERGELRVTRMDSRWLKSRGKTFFKESINQEMLTSIVSHEVAHAINKYQYKIDRERLNHAGDECIAYWLQLSIMGDSLRRKVLANYPISKNDVINDAGINNFIHFSNPHAFGVKCYRKANSENGWPFAQRVYNGEFNSQTE